MPNVLAIVAGIPEALEGRTVAGDGLNVSLKGDVAAGLRYADSGGYDLLVLAGLTVDEQQNAVSQFQRFRRWRVVPVLYVMSEDSPGFAVPGGYRPELDGLVRGEFSSPQVQGRIAEMAQEGAGTADLVVAGPFELDPVHGRLSFADANAMLTNRESEILAILLSQPNRTVSAVEIIERGWGTRADERHLQILRRHVSNIRLKLETELQSRAVRTVRGTGYRFELRDAS
jgi:DNA-binding response OmpR family regulator